MHPMRGDRGDADKAGQRGDPDHRGDDPDAGDHLGKIKDGDADADRGEDDRGLRHHADPDRPATVAANAQTTGSFAVGDHLSVLPDPIRESAREF